MGDNYKLYHAAWDGRYDEVAGLISCGADPAWTHSYGWSALHTAASNGHVRVARLLLDNGWDLEARNRWGIRPLHRASEDGRVEVIQLLAARGAEINCQNSEKRTPLHCAAEYGHSAAIQLLLSLGADRSVKNCNDKTAEEVAEDEETKSVFKNITEDQAQLLTKAVREEDWTSAAILVQGGAPLDTIDDENKKVKILHHAATIGSSGAVKKIIADGQPVEAKDDDGNTVLQLAVKNCHKEVVKMLLSNGATVEAKDDDGNTILQLAVNNRNKVIVKILLSNGATVYCRNNEGRTPLDIAGDNMDEDILKMLLEELLGFTLKNDIIFQEKKFQDFIGYGYKMFHLRKLFRRRGSNPESEERKCFIQYIVDQGNAMIEQQEQLGKPSK